MNILIRQAKITDPGSAHNGKKADLLIENGIITMIRSRISTEKNVKVVESPGLHVSPGWLDLQSNFCDPGYEHKEDLETGIRAAAAGGFTGVAITSATNPPLHSKAQIQYIMKNAADSMVDIYPVGAATVNREGRELSEMYDMKQAGAVAFSDDKNVISNAGVLMRALLYVKNFGGRILTHCDEKTISLEGQMNEGTTSTQLGLKGIPALAEELMISRNLFLAEYTDAPLHIMNVSTKGSAELIRQAKEKGLKVTASANAYSLALDDTLLMGFDSNYKLNPPLRTKEDIDALRKAVMDGTIDAITTDHRPQDIESKDLEFDHASNGMIALESAYALINTHRGRMKPERIAEALSAGPRKILGLPGITISEGAHANITLFDPEAEWTFTEKHIMSKSRNTPFNGTRFKGRVVGIINRKQLFLNKWGN